MKPETNNSEKQLSKDLKTFEELPEGTKELHLLADQAEKSTGTERAALDQSIPNKTKRKLLGGSQG